jgi:hypothetical protein
LGLRGGGWFNHLLICPPFRILSFFFRMIVAGAGIVLYLAAGIVLFVAHNLISPGLSTIDRSEFERHFHEG